MMPRQCAAFLSAINNEIYRYALAITKSRHLAEDVLQDTIIKIYENAGSYTGGKEKAFVMRIAHNLSI